MNGTRRTPKKDWRDAFIEALSTTGNVKLACVAAGIGRTTVYTERKNNDGFAQSWDVALEEAADLLEDEARRRAVEGVAEPIIYKGKIVTIADPETGIETPLILRKYSDTLLIFLLKGARPEKYRENTRHEIVDVKNMTDDQLRAIVDGKG